MPSTYQTPEEFRELAGAFMKSRVLLTAFELRVFSVIGDTPVSSGDVAAAIKADPRATDRLLNALCALALLQKNRGLFQNTESGKRFLTETSPDYLSGLGHSANLYHSWAGLTASVKAGTATGAESSGDREEFSTDSFIAAMHQRAKGNASLPVSRIDLSGVRRMLDVGGGSGVYAAAFVHASRDLSAVLFDLPEVISISRKYVEEAGLSDRIELKSGDYLADDFGSGYDLVWLSAIVHINSLEENRKLVAKCSAALNPGGRVVIQDFIMNDERTAPPQGALFALNMLVNTPRGDTYTESEIGSWLLDAGCTDIQKIPLGPGPSLLIGRKS